MECQSSDSKKLFKVFDASKRKRTRKKREGIADDTNSLATDDSNSAFQANLRNLSGKASMQDLPTPETVDGHQNGDTGRTSNSSMRRDEHRSPRRHRRSNRDSFSLALKASTPRSISPPPEGDGCIDSPTKDQDSLIYAFLEEAIKRDKKKQRHHRREERRGSKDRDGSPREHRHRHRRRKDDAGSTGRDKSRKRKEKSPIPVIDQTVLLETFAKLCAQINDKSTKCTKDPEVKSTHSHKSLQGDIYNRETYNVKQRPEPSYHDIEPTRIRSHENCRNRDHDRHRHDIPPDTYYERPKFTSKMDFKEQKYSSKVDVNRSRLNHEEFRNYPPEPVATRTCIEHRDYRDRPRDSYREYDRRYEDDRRRYCEQKTSRSFDEQRNYADERCRRTSRSDKDKYYDKPIEAQERHILNKERRCRRPNERFDNNSVASRDEPFRERDRYSERERDSGLERERDSGLSVADGASTVSGRSNYLRVVKQEIAEQREAMDKMMNLWKDLMRCFKGISQSQIKDKAVNESACENVRESAAAQLRLWRECMRRYETVARDVGDTDARLMEEISKQRSEMTEMATMWQECLQRYREMSDDFNKLKQKLVTSQSPSRARVGPAVCAEGEGPAAHAPPYIPPPYPIPPSVHPSMYIPGAVNSGVGGMRGRTAAPPWWWGGDPASRRSSPASARDRRRRHKDDREESRYKEKAGKPTAARSEHRRKKR